MKELNKVRAACYAGAGLLMLVAVSACGPSDLGKERLKALHKGMPVDSVLLVMGSGPLEPKRPIEQMMLTNGFRTQRYLKNGSNYTVLYYREEPGEVDEPIAREVQTPILIHEDTVLGWGWKYYLKAVEKIGLPNALEPQAGASLDSIPGAP